MRRVYYSVDRFYVWLLLYFEWLDLTQIYLIFCGSDPYWMSVIWVSVTWVLHGGGDRDNEAPV